MRCHLTYNEPPVLIIRIALLLMLAAFTVLISADVLMWLAVPSLLRLMTELGLIILLTAFALLLITGLLGALRLILPPCRAYFSAHQQKQRRLLFMQSKADQVKQLFYFKAAQVNYFHELTRKRLLNANNRKHIKLLAKTIDQDLLAVKHQLSATTFTQLRQENNRYRNRQDGAALLSLQQKIATLR